MHGLVKATLEALTNGEKLNPQITTSKKYKHWISREDLKRCLTCKNQHGKIWKISETPDIVPPVHPNCRCVIELMKTITAGTATINGLAGADWYIKNHGILPPEYIDKASAINSEWKSGKWPSDFVPGKIITGGIYYNDDGHLPSDTNRIWYEADINYKSGKRNSQRILWSNDGLIFATYDHYATFYEIT